MSALDFDTSSLLQLQRRMASAVMQPLTSDEKMRAQRDDGTDMQHEAAAYVKPNDRLSSFDRLEIYNRQYWFRIFASFEEDYPGLQAVLGREAFEVMMRAYLESCPSSSFSLRNLGAGLSAWLAANQSCLGAPIQLAQDMARLEWAHIEAYDAAELPVPTAQQMAAVNLDTQLLLQPYVRILELAYPVDDLLIQVRHESGSSDASSNNASSERKNAPVHRVATMEPSHLYLAVHRQQFVVYYKRLQREEFLMLQAILDELSLEVVMERAFDTSTITETDRGPYLQQTFQTWATLGWLCQPDNL